MAVVSNEENERQIEEFSFMANSVDDTALPTQTKNAENLVGGETATIPLTRGMVAIVDSSDFDWLSRYRWMADEKAPGYFYAVRYCKERKGNVLMHRQIMDLSTGAKLVIDHINGNTLDNRRANLRACQQGENARNRRGNIRSASRLKGVHRVNAKFWAATIGLNGRKVHLWCGLNPAVGAAVYNHCARLIFGEFAKLNELTEDEEKLLKGVVIPIDKIMGAAHEQA